MKRDASQKIMFFSAASYKKDISFGGHIFLF